MQSPNRTTVALIAAGLMSFVLVVGVSRWIDEHRPAANSRFEEESLYLTGKTLKRASLGFNGLVADWYWMRSLQYVGRKILENPGQLELDKLNKLDMRLLYPLLDTATTVDPQFLLVYKYGSIVLPAVNEEDAIKLTLKGIEQNPNEWRLNQHLGYIYWKRGDYKKASETYDAGAKKPGAPQWLTEMSARMSAQGGSTATAREIYTRLYEQSDDKSIKELMLRRLAQVESFEERDAIRTVLTSYRERTGKCASDWRPLVTELRAVRLASGKPLRFDQRGTPIDPSDAPYVLNTSSCDVILDLNSKVILR